MIPTFQLLYFKNILDVAFIDFFNDYNDSFKKIDDNYVLVKNLSYRKIKKYIESKIINELSKYIVEYDILKPTYFIIIGSCMPSNNILLQFKDSSYFPKKLQNLLLNPKYNIKYILKESDIKIDLVKFNTVCFELFNDFFEKSKFQKLTNNKYSNVIFVQHKAIDCYVMFKILKTIFGRSNCINLHQKNMSNIKSPLIALNDLIDKYVHNKSKLNSNVDFQNALAEIRLFISSRIKNNCII